MPAVQNPHWTAAWSMKACCTGWSPSSEASPSTVTTSRPSTSTASSVHALTGAPSSRTVHAPHTCMSHERLAPLSCSRSLSTSSRSASGRQSTSAARPFTVKRRLRDDRMGITFMIDLTGGAGRRDGEGAPHEDPGHLPLVLRGSVKVGGRLHLGGAAGGDLVGVPPEVIER